MKRNMGAGKKVITAVVISAAIFAGSFAALGAKKNAYTFQSGGAKITCGQSVKGILNSLGKADKVIVQEAVQGNGKERIYSFKGFELCTLSENNGAQKVQSVCILDKNVSTPEGIHLGSTREAVEKAYGTGCKEDEGVLYYTLGDTELKIYLTNDVVDGIEYLIADKS